ncbi:hypothetical protein [Arthrobacter sp. B3I4]|uniref:hypothetical protein n=1 Tax=Arthrobacter sp. B3I4 TaxID=3042267 RepID=UPI0027865F03|nr:hypothetical protein [Arthrobacter sp. B3I4]MDQ0756091.1 hypothetical protein [Arthrobacter sp. B3I4]
MNDQTLWTSGTAVVVAFFTTVIAQYVFAPTLEARKQTLLDRSKVASGIADDIRAMHFQLVLTTTKLFKLNDVYHHAEHSAPFFELSEKFDAADSLKHSGLKSRYVNLALSAQIEADLFTMRLTPPRHEEYDRLMRILDHTAKALDPARLPLTRRFHCWQGIKATGIARRSSEKVGSSDR